MKSYLGWGLLCGVLLAGTVQADTSQGETARNGGYIGLSVGSAHSKYLSDGYESLMDNLAGMGVSTSGDVDKSSGVAKLFLGLRMPGDVLDFRISYVDLGEYEAKGTVAGGSGVGIFSITENIGGVYVSGLLKAPLANNAGAVYVKAGLGIAVDSVEGYVSTSGVGGYTSDSFDETDHAASYTIGLGLNYDIGARWGLQVEAERYYVNAEDDNGKKSFSNAKFDLVTAGIYYRF